MKIVLQIKIIVSKFLNCSANDPDIWIFIAFIYWIIVETKYSLVLCKTHLYSFFF